METKPCVKCGSTERYKPRPGRKFGACKVCTKATGKKWYQANSEKAKATSKTWKQNNVKKYADHIKAHRKAHPEKRAARLMIRTAVRRGDLPHILTCACVDCGVQAAEYHHEDYSKPLEVEPLCKLCHVKRHNPDN